MYERDSRNVVKALSSTNFRAPTKEKPLRANPEGLNGVRKIKVKKIK